MNAYLLDTNKFCASMTRSEEGPKNNDDTFQGYFVLLLAFEHDFVLTGNDSESRAKRRERRLKDLSIISRRPSPRCTALHRVARRVVNRTIKNRSSDKVAASVNDPRGSFVFVSSLLCSKSEHTDFYRYPSARQNTLVICQQRRGTHVSAVR